MGSFLLRNTELEAVRHEFPDCTDVMVDTKVSNAPMIGFLINQGYQIEDLMIYTVWAQDSTLFLSPTERLVQKQAAVRFRWSRFG